MYYKCFSINLDILEVSYPWRSLRTSSVPIHVQYKFIVVLPSSDLDMMLTTIHELKVLLAIRLPFASCFQLFEFFSKLTNSAPTFIYREVDESMTDRQRLVPIFIQNDKYFIN